MSQPEPNAIPGLPLSAVLELFPADGLALGGPPLRDFLAAQDSMRHSWAALTHAVIHAPGPAGHAARARVERAALVEGYNTRLTALFETYTRLFDARVPPPPHPHAGRGVFRDAYAYAIGRYGVADFLVRTISEIRALPGTTPEIARLAAACECQLIHCISMAMGVYMGEFRAAAAGSATAVEGARGVVVAARSALGCATGVVETVRDTVAGAVEDVRSVIEVVGGGAGAPADAPAAPPAQASGADVLAAAPVVAPAEAPAEASGASTDADGEYELEEGEIRE